MKKWYLWFVLAGIFALGGVMNHLDGRSILGAVIQVSVTVAMAFVQLICDKKGEKGKKVFRYIAIGVIIALCLAVLLLLLQ